MLVQLTIRRSHGLPMPASPVDGIRILALLPRDWHKDLSQAAGDIVIRVATDDGTTSAQVRAEVVTALANPEVGDWELTTCHTLPTRQTRWTSAKEENR
jgi:hypothetical protein